MKKPTTIGLLLLLGIAGSATVFLVARAQAEPAIRRKAQLTKSSDSVSGLLKYYIADGMGVAKPYPSYSGKRFVLWLVATGKLNRSDLRQLAILFSPGDSTRSLAKAGGVAAYERIDPDALLDASVDVSRRTSYVGPRRHEPGAALPAAATAHGVPLIADLSFGDVAIVGFATGQVKVMTKEDLGLGPDDPLVAGDASKSPILRQLSE